MKLLTDIIPLFFRILRRSDGVGDHTQPRLPGVRAEVPADHEPRTVHQHVAFRLQLLRPRDEPRHLHVPLSRR